MRPFYWFLAAIPIVLILMTQRNPAYADHSMWIRPLKSGDPLIWGRKDGILFGIPSPGGMPGPRGLIRVGVISPVTHMPQLVNFIATEPVAVGSSERAHRMAYSELEMSMLDPGIQGKRMWIDPSSGVVAGTLTEVSEGSKRVERLIVRLEIERFSANDVHVYIIASVDSDHPGELRLEMYPYPDSARIAEGTFTATMGNYERLRWLFLKHQTIVSGDLYANYAGGDFIERQEYPVQEMLRSSDGSAIAVSASDESSPSSALNSASPFWKYPLPRLTQYWRVPKLEIQPDLRIRVNGRAMYWQSYNLLPGGVAFENFELRQAYEPGQVFIFGLTEKEPWEMRPEITDLVRRPESSR